MTEKSNGNEATPKVKFDIRWEADVLADVRECAKIMGKPVAQFVQDAAKEYIAKEKPKLAKLAALRAKLFLTKP